MQFQENYSLKSYNTFRIGAMARYFTSFTSVDQLQEALEQAATFATARPPLVLGGGSNILLTGDVDGVVLHNGIKGKELLRQDDEFFYVRAGGGEVWHQLVLHCIDNGYAGVE
ncbi:MAG: FAD-binding protein, partial [Chitinophagaceae bacterium]|nr:FAD-binding protein [Chitinophagaceae bacterium]